MAIRKFLNVWPWRLFCKSSTSTSDVASDDPDLIEVPPDEASWEDYQRYQAALMRRRNLGKDD
jgi:hypothetical protein